MARRNYTGSSCNIFPFVERVWVTLCQIISYEQGFGLSNPLWSTKQMQKKIPYITKPKHTTFMRGRFSCICFSWPYDKYVVEFVFYWMLMKNKAKSICPPLTSTFHNFYHGDSGFGDGCYWGPWKGGVVLLPKLESLGTWSKNGLVQL